MHHDHTDYRLVVGHPAYRVGSDGTVWTRWKRVGNGRGNGKGAKCIMGSEWSPLKTGTVRGYTRFNMSVHNTTRSMLLHVAILEAFVGERPLGMQCAHYNGDRKDNRLENLRWATPQENEADKKRHGRSNGGDRNGMSAANKLRRLADLDAAAGGA